MNYNLLPFGNLEISAFALASPLVSATASALQKTCLYLKNFFEESRTFMSSTLQYSFVCLVIFTNLLFLEQLQLL